MTAATGFRWSWVGEDEAINWHQVLVRQVFADKLKDHWNQKAGQPDDTYAR